MRPSVPTFHFSVTSFSVGEFDLKIGLFFPVLNVHKNNPMALLFSVVDSVTVNMLAKFSLCFRLCAYFVCLQVTG